MLSPYGRACWNWIFRGFLVGGFFGELGDTSTHSVFTFVLLGRDWTQEEGCWQVVAHGVSAPSRHHCCTSTAVVLENLGFSLWQGVNVWVSARMEEEELGITERGCFLVLVLGSAAPSTRPWTPTLPSVVSGAAKYWVSWRFCLVIRV